MNRETSRQIARLENLANFIENNPKEYSQSNMEKCIVGLGNRLVGKKLNPFKEFDDVWNGDVDAFSKKFGVTRAVSDNIFVGTFYDINSRFSSSGSFFGVKAKSAVKLLRFLAKKKGENPKDKYFV